MPAAASPPPIEVTGVRTDPQGAVVLVEVEARAGGRRLAFGQVAEPAPGGGTISGLSVDGWPLALVVTGEVRGSLLLCGGRPHLPLPPASAAELADGFREDRVEAALGLLLALFTDGLYSVTRRALPPPRLMGGGLVLRCPREGAEVIDPGPLAPDEGVAVAADLSDGWFLLLGGRDALTRAEPALVISAGFLVAAEGFVAHRHDREKREAFARAPSFVLDDLALRDALAAHRQLYPKADLGPLAEDRTEPAAQLARAVFWDIASEDGVEAVTEEVRVSVGRTTEFRATVTLSGAAYEVALVSEDGRRLGEALIRDPPKRRLRPDQSVTAPHTLTSLIPSEGVEHAGRYRATGIRPAARAIGRALRQLRREET